MGATGAAAVAAEAADGAYGDRNRVERLIDRLRQFRRVATRYEKRAADYLAILTLAAILL